MNIILEFDGVIADQQAAWYAAHVEAAAAVGWSRLDSGTFWRLMRTKGRAADVLPAAKPGKVAEYWSRFDQLLESGKPIEMLTADDQVIVFLAALARHAGVFLVTLGANLEARKEWIARHGVARFIREFHRLDVDPRRRPVELKALANADRRTIVVGASDMLIRSADAAELISVGISSGACTGARLHQAGASVVYADRNELVQSLDGGAKDLVQAGLLPKSLDAPKDGKLNP